MEIEFIGSIVAVSLTTASTILIASQNYAFINIALCIIFSIPFSVFLMLSIKRVKDMKLEKARVEEFIDKMKYAQKLSSKGLSSRSILSHISDQCSDSGISASLGSAKTLSRLGYPVHVAISSAHEKLAGINVMLNSISKEVYRKAFFQNVISRYESKKLKAQSSYASRLQRYSTASMFICSIAPSFLIFGFIGDLVISQKSSDILTLALGLNLLIPLIFTITNFIMSRRLLE